MHPFHDEVMQEMQKWIYVINTRYPNLNFQMPTIDYNLRGNTAGKAWYRKHHIQLHPVFLNAYTKDMLEDTLPHELCHLLAWQLYRHTGHGNEWKQLMMFVFDLEPNRCHSYAAVSKARDLQYSLDDF